MDRVILHCDLNCFYASVELLSHPDLREIPIAVCGDPSSRHGIILAKNEPAKKYGVQTAETIWQAKKKCPGLVLLPPHHNLYREYSHRVNGIYDQYTDLVEPFGIDESWLDVTHTLHLFGGDAAALADALRKRITKELGLTLSVGVSFNKVFAKLGSDYKKPDATTVISRENWQHLVWPLPVGDLLYVGGAARRLLCQYGVETIGQLAACRREMLETLMGKIGVQLYEYANGLDSDPVRPRTSVETAKSVGNSITFPQNLTTREEIRQSLADLREEGVEDILALRGDRVPGVEPKTDFLHASDLVTFIREEGGFSLSGACYPEVHTEAPDPVTDVLNLKKKVDAGAEHLISQLFFDNAAFYAFVERARIAGITVPIEAGIMPVVNARQILRMVSLCGASLPPKFTRMISRYEQNPAALRDAGIAYAIDQIVDLLAQGVEGIHLYTMNDPDVARRISQAVENLREG